MHSLPEFDSNDLQVVADRYCARPAMQCPGWCSAKRGTAIADEATHSAVLSSGMVLLLCGIQYTKQGHGTTHSLYYALPGTDILTYTRIIPVLTTLSQRHVRHCLRTRSGTETDNPAAVSGTAYAVCWH
eukprot:1244869-Rhodomonas_salina.1